MWGGQRKKPSVPIAQKCDKESPSGEEAAKSVSLYIFREASFSSLNQAAVSV